MRSGHRRQLHEQGFDATLAALLFVACEVEVVLALRHDHGTDHWPTPVNILVVAGVTLPLLWRRRAPLAVLIAVKSSVLLLTVGLADAAAVNFPQLVLFIAPYSVAAYAPRLRAAVGLTYSAAIITAVNLLNPSGASSWVFSAAACAGAWATGRIFRARRVLAEELHRTTAQIAADRHGLELLAIAEQRTRIAAELQSLVAVTVSSMIVQTQAAQRLLSHDAGQADAAMAAIEDTGRQALNDLRRILGVLRNHDGNVELAPQPGVGQIPALVEKNRTADRPIGLQVTGEPGPLPTSVDLALYRILAEALETTVEARQALEVTLCFREQQIELHVTADGSAPLIWPTVGMCERAALCQGSVAVDTAPGGNDCLRVRLPRVFEGVAA